MNVNLLKNLGVNEAVIEALIKSYENLIDQMEILKDNNDLKFVVNQEEQKKHILTIQNFFDGRNDNFVQEEKSICRDTLEFLLESVSNEFNVKINDVMIHLCDSSLKLLRHLTEARINSEQGWCDVQDLRDSGAIGKDGYQSFSRLRNVISGYLLKKNPKEFIESNGRKQYRLSIDSKQIIFSDKIEK